MSDRKPRCVYPRTSGAACGKTEAQHGPATGHAFTLEHIDPPSNPDREVPVPETTAGDLGPEGRRHLSNGYTRHGHTVDGVLHAGKPQRVARCGGPGLCLTCRRDAGDLLERQRVNGGLVMQGEVHAEATAPGQGEPYHPGTLVEGDPLEGTLLSSVPDPTVTLRTEMPDGTLVEVTVAHPTHDTVKMARTALVAAEYVMGAIAREHTREPGEPS